jgi:rhodanese-related sulfurtransferase
MERERLVIIDARSADAWSKATSQAAGAIRVPPDDVASHVGEIPRGRPIVAYCT